MNKKDKRNQDRKRKNALASRQRHKRYLKTKHSVKSKKMIRQVETKRIKQPLSPRMIWLRAKKLFGRWILCPFGIHQWLLMSGLPGTPKYLCPRCMKKSKVKW